MTAFFVLAGTFFVFVAALGVVRLPDVYTRMHAVTKASSLGLSLLLVGAAFRTGHPEDFLKILLGVVFLFLTAPVATHLLARAASLNGAPRDERTVVDELDELYRNPILNDPSDHRISNPAGTNASCPPGTE